MDRSEGKRCTVKKVRTYNNGEIAKRFEEGKQPNGFVLGMLPKSEEEKRQIQKKKKQTLMKHYGVDNPAKSKDIQDRIKKTNLEKYGVEHPLQSKDIMNKMKDSMISRYGVKHALQSKEFTEKVRKTSLDRYGTEYYQKTDECKEKIKQTNIKRYGTENPMQNSNIRKKANKTNLERYGNSCAMQSKEIQQRIRKRNLEKYGCEFSIQSDEVRRRIENTNIGKYGSTCPFSSKSVIEKACNTNIKKYGVERPLQNSNILEKERKTNIKKYGVSWTCLRHEAKIGSNNSGPNQSFACKLDKYHITYEREYVIDSYSYDFKIGDILVEIDPTVTHNTIWSPFGDHKSRIDETYHKRKSEESSLHGFRCIHVFDWNDEDKVIKQFLTERENVYARKCRIQEISVEEADSFLNQYHLQGTCRGQSIRIALTYQDEIVSLMTFGKPRYNKNYEYELLRYCTSKNVTGGSRKIFKYFLKKYNSKSIISYCDKSKFLGNVYRKLGFISKTLNSPSKHWYSPKDSRHITDGFLRQRGFDQLFNTEYGKGASNSDLMIEHGYLPVYDCGQETYVWISTNK